MSHKIENNFKGALGEHFIREIFLNNGLQLMDPGILIRKSNDDDLKSIAKKYQSEIQKYRIPFFPDTSPEQQEAKLASYEKDTKFVIRCGEGRYDLFYRGGIEVIFEQDEIDKTFGTQTLPDFIVMNKYVLIEVKSGNSARLEDNQKAEYPKLLGKGFRVFILKMVIVADPWKIKVVLPIKCSELTVEGNQSIEFEKMITDIKAMPIVQMAEPSDVRDTYLEKCPNCGTLIIRK